ncbi:hypothetical protein [Nocardioides terrisoli]|uniref:hypothetical protein n=1 Tax=Nocardioides terrisoli TaxID=3388267 RepID=UPI00287B654F|nr:hypothetical protein [Nocardioides marmorisolisilvae]
MGTDLTADPDAFLLVREQHEQLRDLLDQLARQPRVTERIEAGQLRRRGELLDLIGHSFVAQDTARHRWLWGPVTAGWTDGPPIRKDLRRRSRRIAYLLVKLDWFGDRDSEVDDVVDELDDEIRALLGYETELLGRHQREPTADLGAIGRRMARGGLLPTRPHPDMPGWPGLARLLQLPLAVRDRIADLVTRPPTGS